jgi:hypothetical protein
MSKKETIPVKGTEAECSLIWNDRQAVAITQMRSLVKNRNLKRLH